jgi:hypothetical protein
MRHLAICLLLAASAAGQDQLTVKACRADLLKYSQMSDAQLNSAACRSHTQQRECTFAEPFLQQMTYNQLGAAAQEMEDCGFKERRKKASYRHMEAWLFLVQESRLNAFVYDKHLETEYPEWEKQQRERASLQMETRNH